MFDIRKIQEQVIFEAVKAASDEETAHGIVHGAAPQGTEDDATWVKSTMTRLEDRFDRASVRRIRMNCQCGYGMEEKLELVRELMRSSSSLAEFAGQAKAQAAGLSCVDGELYLQFPFCPCPMLATVDRLDTDTWCQCTTGYSQVLFERAFGVRVEVELLKSVKMGDDHCLMRIVPLAPVWK